MSRHCESMVVPGARSFHGSQITLLETARHVGLAFFNCNQSYKLASQVSRPLLLARTTEQATLRRPL